MNVNSVSPGPSDKDQTSNCVEKTKKDPPVDSGGQVPSTSSNGVDTTTSDVGHSKVNGDLLTEELEKQLMPSTVCGQLQLMFAFMQFTSRR